MPKSKIQLDKKQRQMVFDYHLLFNHAPPSTVMKNLANLHLQYDPKKILPTAHAPMHCTPYAKRKIAQNHRAQHAYHPGEAISLDVAGPFNYNGQRLDDAYFITCIDAASRYAVCVPIIDRTEAVPFIQQCITQFMSIFNKPPQVFVSDNAKEYVSKDMQQLLDVFNVQNHTTTPYSAQENGIAERINQTFLNAIRAALYTAELPPSNWIYALHDVVDK